ncbi:citrate/2-methylcitrate synthase [Methanimicrococcus blatticola]|uniref:Citrate synthase n=1 Tax=Methanimicrococcus blatticola TaxID=91560 RepID=A0A484F5Z9_9EURY|nr:citrate/2-methylcitrate synthase [Methanimicrococcus blatticola]MBZ3936139.1 citrate/2-methylcitrate synthase [Methanimicrococcus blatticola]MCC2508382.1 citrate/2-methylcitrate synthase [Methanimicrococcus blatticola]TDQ70165.1 citrate synthase [Methanimicrococcus blatticola]
MEDVVKSTEMTISLEDLGMTKPMTADVSENTESGAAAEGSADVAEEAVEIEIEEEIIEKTEEELAAEQKAIVEKLAKHCEENGPIDPEFFNKYDVNRGLRDADGNGVLTGLTEISDVQSGRPAKGETEHHKGRLFYRGIDINELVGGFVSEKRFGFEEVSYLLLFGVLPTEEQLAEFKKLLGCYRTLPENFVRDVIMKAPSEDMMNSLAKSVLTLYSYDKNPDDTSIENVLRQCLELIALFPVMAVYGYQAYVHKYDGSSLTIHNPQPDLSAAENILYLLRPDSKYTELEARLLDLALVLHAEHGGGNNSTFTCRVVSSSGTDTYSAIAAALGSLKGPKHGGANIKVVKMFEDMKANITDWTSEEEVSDYLRKLLNKQAFDNAGLIYGIGHAVYSLNDPRADIFKRFVENLSIEKGREDEFKLYALVERLAPEIIGQEKRIYKGVSANIDFYSGFVYSMLDLPMQLYTPIFAISRITGWSAHRLEELINSGKIIRPAYNAVGERQAYIPLKDRSSTGKEIIFEEFCTETQNEKQE